MSVYDWERDIAPYLHTMQPVEGGYSTAKRGIVTLKNGEKVFVKSAEGDVTSRWLMKEIDVYKRLNGATFPFIPQLLSYSDNRHAMAIEYLSTASFDTEWDEDKLNAIIEVQAELKKYKHIFVNDPAYTLESVIGLDAKWPQVLTDEAVDSLNTKFRTLGVDVILTLKQLEHYEQQLFGWKLQEDTLVHQDIRADNFGYDTLAKQGKLIDWNWLCIGDENLDRTPLFVNMFVAGFDPYTYHPETYDTSTLIYLISFWLERLLSGNETADEQEFKRRHAQARSVKAAIELIERTNR